MPYSITEKCIGCGICEKNCPTFAVSGEVKQKHFINEKRCISCGVCGSRCPVSAILDSNKKPCEKEDKTYPVIKTENCSSCSVCISHCNKNALSISLPKEKGDLNTYAVLDKSKCVSCGICAHVCPMGCIEMKNKKLKFKNNSRFPKYAIIDLGTNEFSDYNISEEYYRLYVGGKALASRLLFDMTEKGIDPLDEEAVIIVNTGPLNGTGAPSSSRFNITFKNVLTGGIATTNSGGTFGIKLKEAGYDGLIIKGKAGTPSYIEILDGEIKIKDGTNLWGKGVFEVQNSFPDYLGKLFIGPAGENLVKFAGIASGERYSARCGAGAVFGSKNLKGIVCFGTYRPYIHNEIKFKKFIKKWVRFIKNHPMTGEALPSFGSAGLVNKANASMALPTHNFKKGFFKEADKFSGETLAETLLVKNSGCISCPIRCERRVMRKGEEIKGPEFETLGLFDSNMELSSLKDTIEINYLCDDFGMDTISLAGTLSFVMELKERGVKDFGISFENAKSVISAIPKIAKREGEYSEIANGSKWLSEKYGGGDFAIHSKGLELASYEPRRSVGMGLGYATSNRGGCHLNGGYMALLESVGVLTMDALTPKGKAGWTIFMQDALDAISAGGSCLFSAQTFIPSVFYKLGPNSIITKLVGKLLPTFGPLLPKLIGIAPLLHFNSFLLLPHAEGIRLVTGLKMFTGSFVKFGDRAYNIERLYSFREGVYGADTLPKRLTDVLQDKKNPKTKIPLEKMLKVFYKERGWDGRGVPTEKTLKRLKIKE